MRGRTRAAVASRPYSCRSDEARPSCELSSKREDILVSLFSSFFFCNCHYVSGLLFEYLTSSSSFLSSNFFSFSTIPPLCLSLCAAANTTSLLLCIFASSLTVMTVKLCHWAVWRLSDPQKQIGLLSRLEEDHIVTALHLAQLVDHLKVLVMFDFVLLLGVWKEFSQIIHLHHVKDASANFIDKTKLKIKS